MAEMSEGEKLRIFMSGVASDSGMRLLERAMAAAREEGRRAGLEEAAIVADDAAHNARVAQGAMANTENRRAWDREAEAAQDIARSIRQLVAGADKAEHVHTWEAIGGDARWCPCGAEKGT